MIPIVTSATGKMQLVLDLVGDLFSNIDCVFADTHLYSS